MFFCYRHFKSQYDNIEAKWNIPEDFQVVYTVAEGEMTIGGVFLRLFIANPGWVLRKPKEFIVELLEKWSALVVLQNPDVSSQRVTKLNIYLKYRY